MIDRRTRVALAAAAYDAGRVRLAERDLAGFEHIVATRHGLFAVNHRERRPIAFGLFYGLTVSGDTIYAFEACDEPRARTRRGRIIRLFRDGDTIADADIFATGLDNGCHQIDFIHGHLCVADTYNQRIVRFAADGAADLLQPVSCGEAHDWDTGFAHINSLIARGDEIMLMLHNGADRTGRPSEIAVCDSTWRLIRRAPIAGMGCHNFAVLEDGTLLSCGSSDGELIGTNGVKVKICDMMTRGLSVDSTQIVVGGSTFSERDLRDQAGGAIHFLDRDYRPIATLPFPAPPMEIRRIDGRDRSLSAFVAAVPPRGSRSCSGFTPFPTDA